MPTDARVKRSNEASQPYAFYIEELRSKQLRDEVPTSAWEHSDNSPIAGGLTVSYSLTAAETVSMTEITFEVQDSDFEPF